MIQSHDISRLHRLLSIHDPMRGRRNFHTKQVLLWFTCWVVLRRLCRLDKTEFRRHFQPTWRQDGITNNKTNERSQSWQMQETPVSTCLMLAGKRLSSRTEIWQRTIRQYLIAPSAGMNYNPADNSAWCTNRHTERSEEIPLCLKLFYLISLHTFISRRSECRIKSFWRILEILTMVWCTFHEHVGVL